MVYTYVAACKATPQGWGLTMFVSSNGDWCLSPETDSLRFGAGMGFPGGLFFANAPLTAFLGAADEK